MIQMMLDPEFPPDFCGTKISRVFQAGKVTKRPLLILLSNMGKSSLNHFFYHHLGNIISFIFVHSPNKHIKGKKILIGSVKSRCSSG